MEALGINLGFLFVQIINFIILFLVLRKWVFGPILGGKLGDMGNFAMAFIIVGVLCLVAAGIVSALKPPVKTTETVPVSA